MKKKKILALNRYFSSCCWLQSKYLNENEIDNKKKLISLTNMRLDEV